MTQFPHNVTNLTLGSSEHNVLLESWDLEMMEITIVSAAIFFLAGTVLLYQFYWNKRRQIVIVKLAAQPTTPNGVLIHNIPTTLKIGTTYQCETRIARDTIEALRNEFLGGPPEAEIGIALFKTMNAVLISNDQKIDVGIISANPQLVYESGNSGDEFYTATWLWSLSPKISGHASLELRLYKTLGVGQQQISSLTINPKIERDFKRMFTISGQALILMAVGAIVGQGVEAVLDLF